MGLNSAVLTKMGDVVRLKGYSPNTLKTYRGWCEKYILWLKEKNGGKWLDPKDCGRAEIEPWLTELATHQNVAPNSQNSAFQSVLFLYREVIKKEIRDVDALRAKSPKHMPVYLSKGEVADLLSGMTGRNKLIVELLYGCGLRIGETLALRVKDIDFGNNQIHIFSGKGAKSRIVGMPKCLRGSLKQQVESARRMHAMDTENGCCRVEVPYS